MGINQPPLAAVHINSQEAKEGDEIVLDGKDSSDPNGDPLTYFWKQTSGFLDGFDIINPTDSVAHFKVPEDLTKDTTFEFELDVRDNFGGISTESVSIDATSNTAPIADAGGNLQAIRGEQVTLDGSASHDPDPTGKIISYLWKSGEDNDGIAGLSLRNANQPVAVLSVPLVQDDTTFEFTLTVTDDEGAAAEDTVEVEVEAHLLHPLHLLKIQIRLKSLKIDLTSSFLQYHSKRMKRQEKSKMLTLILTQQNYRTPKQLLRLALKE
jgi:hypothetical protein